MTRTSLGALYLFALAAAIAAPVVAQAPAREPREFLPAPWDRYFARRVAELSRADWQEGITPENWPAKQAAMRIELRGMLGLDPWPARGELKPQIAGTVAGDGFIVEKLHFQSLPGLYVTANFYRPTELAQPLPAILYVCGHSRVVENGVSLGNKTDYQHHGIWFARHGYACLIIDTIELGEIPGEHHGTYNRGRWWWVARGYTPAGVEAWNGIRALDYLETRPEVDRTRIGVTGRSGGGAYSWWAAALDDRVKVAVPVAGITSLKNHILDGAVEGHCDCMFMVNTARWDFDRVAALVAPRPLLISNTDKDDIFPLDGVMEIYNRTRALYRKLGHEEAIGVHIAEGPHKDTQPLNFGAFAWMNRFLKGADRMELIDEPARKSIAARELKVFGELPRDEVVTRVDEVFVPAFSPRTNAPPPSRDELVKALLRDCFRAWPSAQPNAVAVKKSESLSDDVRTSEWEFVSEEPFTLNFTLLVRDDVKPEEIALEVLDGETAQGSARTLADGKRARAFIAPRGVGPTGWARLTRNKQTQLRRRLHLIGESLESSQVWDICQAAAAVRSVPGFDKMPLVLRAQKAMAANALYASFFIPGTTRLDLAELPASHRDGPIYLNVLRHIDLSQAVQR